MEGVLIPVDPSQFAKDDFSDEPAASGRGDGLEPAENQDEGTDRPGVEASERSDADAAPGHDEPIEIVPMRVVEAVLFASDVPMPPQKIAAVLGVGDARDVRKHIAALNAGYAATGQSFRIEEIAGGFQMMTLPAYNRWLVKLLRARQDTKLSGAAMETLSIVAYKQPCTRADIEAIRGVAAGDILNRLREMNLIKIVGRAEDLGRPLLYGTTRRFLEVFGLPGLEDLPEVDALKMGGLAAKPAPNSTAAEAQDGDGAAESSASTDALPREGVGGNEQESAPAEIRGESDPLNRGEGTPSRDADVTEEAAALSPDSNDSGASGLPFEASADLRPNDPGAPESLQHPPPKAVVTRRTRRPKGRDQRASGPSSDQGGAGPAGGDNDSGASDAGATDATE